MKPLFHVILLGVALSGDVVVADDVEPARGAELIAPFKEQLKLALSEGLAGGPVAAIDICRLKAPAIARGVSRDTIRMGRTSHRLRNPDNAAPDWVAPIIAEWLAGAPQEPRTVALGEATEGYVEPIRLQPMCVACHGEFLADDVTQAIAAAYPEDEAIDFAVGDLRGAFWVEYPAE